MHVNHESPQSHSLASGDVRGGGMREWSDSYRGRRGGRKGSRPQDRDDDLDGRAGDQKSRGGIESEHPERYKHTERGLDREDARGRRRAGYGSAGRGRAGDLGDAPRRGERELDQGRWGGRELPPSRQQYQDVRLGHAERGRQGGGRGEWRRNLGDGRGTGGRSDRPMDFGEESSSTWSESPYAKGRGRGVQGAQACHGGRPGKEAGREGARTGDQTPLSRGEPLSLDDAEVGGNYQGFVYASHETHGFFFYFGRLDPGGKFRSFECSGRITRSGLPSPWIADMERRVLRARESAPGLVRPEWLLPLRVKSMERPVGGKPRVELILVPERKLLILDLNGVLFNRYSVHDERRGLGEIQKRPKCEEFLDFCFEHFHVACWSCCNKETMELGVFGAREKDLLFSNYSAHSINLWPRHSAVSVDKPLFLKDLSRLWKQQLDRVAFDASSTILVDNHLEKFERNPLGTCVLVPEYSDAAQPPDDLLSLEGELVAHLRAMAHTPDSGAYVRGTASAFFPTAHPIPPYDLSRLKAVVLQAFCASECMRRERPDLTVGHYMERKETPGPRAIQLRRKSLVEVAGPRAPPHVVCEKSDGTRLFLLVPEEKIREEIEEAGGGRAGGFLLDRQWKVERLAEDGGDWGLSSVLSPRGETSLLDGELVRPLPAPGRDTGEEEGRNGGATGDAFLFLVFDVVFLDGRDVGAIPSLGARMQAVKDVIGSSPTPSRGPLSVKFGLSRPGCTLTILPKEFYALDHLSGMLNTMMRPCGGKSDESTQEAVEVVEEREAQARMDQFIFDDGQRRSISDGLVFTPSCVPYYLYQVHKFKTPGRISIDFKVKKTDLDDASSAGNGLWEIPLYLTLMKFDTKFTALDLRREDAYHRLVDHFKVVEGALSLSGTDEKPSECVVECDFARGAGGGAGSWVLRLIRGDKARPNSVQTAWNNLEALAEGLALEELVEALERLRLETSCLEKGEKPTVDEVADHYDVLQKRRWEAGEGALDPRIHNLRRLNNWIKAVLIEMCGGLRRGLANDEKPVTEEDQHLGAMSNPLATVEDRNAAALSGGSEKDGGRRRGCRGGLRAVIDMACGRGGDLGKWVMQGADIYVGFDSSEQSVIECRSRVEESQRRRGRPRCSCVFRHSMLSGTVADAVIDRLGGKGLDEELERNGRGFDAVSIQFALHYACASETCLSGLLRDVGRLLRDDGLLILTCVDDRTLGQHLALHPSGTFGNAVYRVEFSPDSLSNARGDGEPLLHRLGQRYTFSLSSAVEACAEYVVPALELAEIAAKVANLKLVYRRNFGSFVYEHLSEYGHLLEALRVGVVTEEEWEAIQLYSVMVFRMERS